MTAPFPLTIRPREPEACHAAVARLSARWGAADPLRFGRRIGHPLTSVTQAAGVGAFCARAGLEEVAVERHSPIVDPKARTVVLRGEILRLGDWSMRSRRRCHACLGEDVAEARRLDVPPEWWATSRPWWDVRSIDACPEHGCRLVDTCGACGTTLTWRMGLLHCPCGAEQPRVGRTSSPTSVSSYILSRLSYGPPIAVPVLDAMPLADAIRAMELLGTARSARPDKQARRSEERLASDRVAGLAVASDWPRGFAGVLDALVARRSGLEPDGLLATYGALYSEVCVGGAPKAIADLVAPLLRDHAVAHGIIARDEERLGATVPPTITATEAARRLNRSYATTRRVLDEGDAVPRGSRRGVGFALDPQVVSSADRPRPRPASSLLGVGRMQARTVLRDVAVVDALATLDRTPAELVPAILAATGTSTSAHAGLTPLPEACRNMSVPLATACEAILARRIRVARCGTVDDGLRAALIDQRDLATLRPDRPTLSMEAVARLLAIHHEAVLQLARRGAFGSLTAGRPEREAVMRFAAEHVTAAQLARSRGTSPARLRRTLAAVGVRPSFAPPACRQVIYLRADVPTVH